MIAHRAPTFFITSFYSSSEGKYEITRSSRTLPSSLLNRKWNFGAFMWTSERMKPIHFSRPAKIFQRRCGIFSGAIPRDQETPEPLKDTEKRYTYDVFLSFRGEDTRKNFVDHLRNALHQKGITTFRDDADRDLPRGKSISPELIRAIEESRYVLVIFSKNYASSTWCLDEIAKIVECKDIVGGSVMPIFYKINPSNIRKMKGSIQRDFAKHERNFKDETQKLEKWKAALKVVASLSGRELNDGYESQFIHKLVGEIETRLGRRFPYVPDNLVGIEARIASVIEHLRLGESDKRSIGICGMGGIGKTTIARAIYDSIRDQFEGSSFLANVREVSKKNSLMHLQNQLLHDILKDGSLSIEDVHKGANMIKERLQYKNVVLILDDVDEKDRFESLARDLNWFGRGSRIIMTTRDEHLLIQYGVNMVYKVEKLINEEALKLFCSKAFKSNHPPKEFEDLSKQVIGYCDGLPLALDVLGSFLCNRSLEQWGSALARLKECPEGKIFNQLRISYDGLQEKEKEIFLDIACFFKGKDKSYVTEILDNCGFYPYIGIEVLIDRSLVMIEDNKLWMHDLLQDMAWQIVRQESPKEPGQRSRVWLFEDLRHILIKNSGTRKLEGIVLQSGDWKAVNAKGESFTDMTNLRFLHVHAIHLSSKIKHLSNELRILTWDNCSLKTFPANFYPENLLELNMHNSQFMKFWRGKKVFKKLKIIDLSGSKSLVETPNFRDIPNLERLNLRGCKRLYEVHPSIGVLDKLNILDLSECENLIRLPESVGNLKSLRILNLSRCSNLEELPENIGDLECLEELDISRTVIMHLPSSLTFLKNLITLCLHGWKGLQSRNALNSRHSRLPSFSGLSSLMKLDMSDCNLQEGEIPDDISCLTSLASLDLSQNSFSNLPANINLISNLRILVLNHCKDLRALPRLPESIIFVEADKCLQLTRISNAFIICTVPDDGFCFINCTGFLPKGLDLTFRQKYSLSLFRYAICCSVYPMSTTYVVSPECGLPKWIRFQDSGPSVGIDLLPFSWFHFKWRGFMICAYFEQSSCYSWMDQHFTQVISCQFLIGGKQFGPTFTFPIRFVDSGCVWLGFVSRFQFPQDTRWQDMSSCISVSFCITNPRLTIAKCGVHLLYEQDHIEFDEFLVKWASSSSRDCDSIYHQFLQPPDFFRKPLLRMLRADDHGSKARPLHRTRPNETVPKYHKRSLIEPNSAMGEREPAVKVVSCGVCKFQLDPQNPGGSQAAEFLYDNIKAGRLPG